MTKRPTLLPIKSKTQKMAVVFIGSVIAIVVFLTIFSDATHVAQSFFSNF